MTQPKECPHCKTRSGILAFLTTTTVHRVTYEPDGPVKSRKLCSKKEATRRLVYCAGCLKPMKIISALLASGVPDDEPDVELAPKKEPEEYDEQPTLTL